MVSQRCTGSVASRDTALPALATLELLELAGPTALAGLCPQGQRLRGATPEPSEERRGEASQLASFKLHV